MSDTSPWDAFDCVRCINLMSRPDRKERVTAAFKSVGLDSKVHFYHPVKSPHGGIYGVCESHFVVIKQSFEAGEQNVLIFEDDVIFQPGWEAVVADVTAFMQANSTWEQIFLGCGIFYVNGASCMSNIYNVDAVLCHAYCLSHRGMRHFLEGWGGETSRGDWPVPNLVIDGVDVWWVTRSSEQYAHVNNVAIDQEWDLHSDNLWPQAMAQGAWIRPWLQNVLMIGMLQSVLRPLIWATAALPMALRPTLHNWSYIACDGTPRRPPLLWLLFVLPVLSWVFTLRHPPPKFSLRMVPSLAWEFLKHMAASLGWWWNLNGIRWSKTRPRVHASEDGAKV